MGPVLTAIRASPPIETRPTNLEISAGLAHITGLIGVINNTQFAPDFLLISGNWTHPPSPKWRSMKVSR
jgi:hypothetical protein